MLPLLAGTGELEMSGSEEEERPLKKYSGEEIKTHQSPESLWVVVHDKVYDVTKFMDEVRSQTASPEECRNEFVRVLSPSLPSSSLPSSPFSFPSLL